MSQYQLIEFALRDHLLAASAVQAFVANEIYPVRIPRPDDSDRTRLNKAKLTYRRKTGGRSHYLGSSDGHPQGQFEIVCWSRSYDEAKLLASAVLNAMDAFSGDFGSITVAIATNTNEMDGFIEPEDGSDEGWFMILLEFAIRYTESLPTFANSPV